MSLLRFAEHGGATFCVRDDTQDMNAARSCFVEDEYKLVGWVRPGDICIDIGAHIGGATMLMGALGGKVYAYEALGDNYDLLKFTVDYNGLDAVAHHLAVGGHCGPTVTYTGWFDQGVHRFISTLYHVTGESHEVEMVTLDAIMADIPHCRVIKIDCEGAEYEILEATSEETFGRIDRIVGEYHLVHGPNDHPRKQLLEYTKGLFVDVTGEPEHVVGTGAFDFRRKGEWGRIAL